MSRIPRSDPPIPKPDPITRGSSFADSFYQTTENPTVAEALETEQRFQASPPLSPMPSARRKTHVHARASSRRIFSNLTDMERNERIEDERPANHVLSPTTNFIDDTQSYSLNISAEENVFGAFDDREVLEQYRFMAQHEASLRVKENFGFDILEYEKRRKLISSEQVDDQKHYGLATKPKIKLPPPKPVLATAIPTLKPEEPPMPPTSTSWNASKFLDPRIRQPRDPDLGLGTSVRGGATIPHDEHVVRCLGCRGQLRVKLTATLVQCPECSTVSPASSTRR